MTNRISKEEAAKQLAWWTRHLENQRIRMAARGGNVEGYFAFSAHLPHHDMALAERTFASESSSLRKSEEMVARFTVLAEGALL